MITTKQRTVFNLNKFVLDLEQSLVVPEDIKDEDEIGYVEDVMERLKNFVSHSSPKVVESSYKYLTNHPLVLEDTRMKSFIEACFN